MILVDLDGVLCDLVTPLLALFGRTPPPGPWPSYSLGETLGLPEADVWRRVEREGAAFWAELPPTPWAAALDNVLDASHEPWLICTSPTRDPACAAGKIAWLQRRYGAGFRRFVLTPHKDALALPGRRLLDDSDRNVDAFVAAGGDALLVPQPWNRAGAPVADLPARVAAWLTTC